MNNGYVASLREMIALGFLGVAGNISPFILPVIVGALVDYMDFSIRQASYIAAADMFGLGAGTLIWSRFIITANWRKFAFIAALLLLLGNAVCAVADSYAIATLSRFVAGTGGGLMLTIGVSGLANTRNPDRVVAVYTLLVTVTASVVLYVFPFLLVYSGAQGMFFAMAGFACLAAVASFYTPERSPRKRTKTDTDARFGMTAASPLSIRVMGALGVLIVFFSMSLFWVYIERLGVAAGFVTAQISAGLGTAQFTGVLGALAAAVIATRFGSRMAPMLFCVGLALLAAVIVPYARSFSLFLAAASALIFSWNMLYPYAIGLMSALDQSAKLVTYALFMMTLGKSLSPVLGAWLVSETEFSPAYLACAVCFVCAAILFLPAIRLTDRWLKNPQSAIIRPAGK